MKAAPNLVEISASKRFNPILDESQPVIAYFAQNAEKYPDRLAVVDTEKEYSYRTLNILANRLAHSILAVRGEGEEPVLFLLGREAAAVVSILGIWKAGKFYIGLDTADPINRLRTLVGEAKAGLLVTNHANLALARELSEGKLDIINLDEIDPSISPDDPAVPIQPDALAAVFYTSGSTGEPKGVMLDQRAVSFRAGNNVNLHNYGRDDRFMVPFSLSFVGSTAPLYSAFASGGTAFICELNSMTVQEIAHWLLDRKITIAFMIPSLFTRFLSTLPDGFSARFPDIRLVHCGTETLDLRHLETWKKRFSPKCILSHGFGSTEAGVLMHILYDFRSVVSSSRPAPAKPFPWVKIFIVDDSGKPVVANQIGNIAVRSKGITRGYWRRPDLNETIFADDPEEPGTKILVSKDLGRLHADGKLEFMGRGDAMIKLRGFRIEPGEIEAAFREHAAVSSAVVVGKPNPNAGDEITLVAYVVLEPETFVSAVQLREFLTSRVPDYMVPAHYVFLAQLPLNRNGKIDRQSLPDPDWAASHSGSEYVAPRTEIEKYLTTLWQELLAKEKIGIQDSFFMLGGHSLAAFRMMASIEKKLGIKVPLQILIKHPTVSALAVVIGNMQMTNTHRSVIALREEGRFPALFMVPAGGSHALSLMMIVGALQVPCKVYGLEYPGMDGYLEPYNRMETLASFFVEQIRAVQPQGPYYLGGMCFGTVVAFETARQLKAQGQEIRLVAILDGLFPELKPRRKGIGYLIERLTTLHHPENRGYISNLIKNRIRRVRSNWHRDLHSRRVMKNLEIARANYTPSPLTGRGLAILSSDSKGTSREASWRRLFSEFNCVYVPNTSHQTIFSEEHRQEVARLLSQNIY